MKLKINNHWGKKHVKLELLSEILNAQFYVKWKNRKKRKREKLSWSSKSWLELCHKNLLKMSMAIKYWKHSQCKENWQLIGNDYCVVMVTIVSPGKGWWHKLRPAEKIGGEELERARSRPAVPKAWIRALINLRKTFSLIEMGEKNENKS